MAVLSDLRALQEVEAALLADALRRMRPLDFDAFKRDVARADAILSKHGRSPGED